MQRKQPKTVGEYLASREYPSVDFVEQMRQLSEAVAETENLWDGEKLVGEPKKFQKFIDWKPEPAKKKTVHKRTDKNKPKVEPHYDVIEIASAWGMSTDLVRTLFRNEAGVLTINRPATRNKRSYSTIRVPESVMKRVHTRLSAR